MLIPRTVLNSLTVAAHHESCRYALGGVYLERADDTAFAVATDGSRLLVAEWKDNPEDFPPVGLDILPAPGSDFAQNGKVIPSADCAKLAKSARATKGVLARKPSLNFVAMEESSANGRMKFAATDGQTVAAVDVASIDGRFPRWRDVMPGDRNRVSHFTFQSPEATEREISGFGDYCRDARKLAEETAVCGIPSAAAVKIRLDARYLAELAKAIHDVTGNAEDSGLTLEVPLDPTKPVTLANEGNGVKVRAVLMPLRG
jgi:hypothetical protein